MNKERKEQLNEREDSKLRERAQQRALAEAAQERQETIHNADFLSELRDPDIDDEEHSEHIEAEFPSWFSGARAVTNRGEDWDLEADLIMQNKRERAVTQRRPGRLLRDRPFMLAAMRGDESPQLDAYANDPGIPGGREEWSKRIAAKQTTKAPVTSEQQARIFNAAEVSADLMTLSRDAAGLESVSTVKTESTVNREEESSTASRVGRVLE